MTIIGPCKERGSYYCIIGAGVYEQISRLALSDKQITLKEFRKAPELVCNGAVILVWNKSSFWQQPNRFTLLIFPISARFISKSLISYLGDNRCVASVAWWRNIPFEFYKF